jgi:hypothetical protein
MPILSRSVELSSLAICFSALLIAHGSMRAQDAGHGTSNIMVRVATNPAPVPGGSTSPDSIGITLLDCRGEQATLDHKSVTSTIPGTTPRQFQVDPEDDDPKDLNPKVTPTTKIIDVREPAPCEYTLRITGYGRGAYSLQLHAQGRVSDNGFVSFDAVPAYPDSRLELKLNYAAKPFKFEVKGGLRPDNGAFSFAQPTAPDVRLPAREKSLALVIFYDQRLQSSSFRVSLDAQDVTRRFHPRSGQRELVRVPLPPGEHVLVIDGEAKDGASSHQEFHVQH